MNLYLRFCLYGMVPHFELKLGAKCCQLFVASMPELVRAMRKNTNRVRCRGNGYGSWNGRPGYRHYSLRCGGWFCPRCVPDGGHHCRLPEPENKPEGDILTCGQRDSYHNLFNSPRPLADRDGIFYN